MLVKDSYSTATMLTVKTVPTVNSHLEIQSSTKSIFIVCIRLIERDPATLTT